MITPELKQRLAKIYELVKRGDTEGEKQAAQKALERLLEKHNLEGIDLESIDKQVYNFKYSSEMEVMLLHRIICTLLEESIWMNAYRYTGSIKEVRISLTYLDYITLESAYGYFKRHMIKQWRTFCLPNLKRCKTAKSKAKRRGELVHMFFNKYCIASNLYKQHELTTTEWDDMSKSERRDRANMAKVEGGKFNRQMTSGLLLEA